MSRPDPMKAGFLDSLGRLFRKEAETAPATPQTSVGLGRIEEEFEAALRALNERIVAQRQAAGAAAGAGPGTRRRTAEELAAERAQRIEAIHLAMRQDIEAMHAKLGTGLVGSDLDAIRDVLLELEAMAAAGKGSYELLPRARWAIAEKLRAESGELAVERVVAMLGEHRMAWPDPSRPPASSTSEEIERAHRRRLTDVRRAFIADSFVRTADSLQGIVRGWGVDYPDRGSPLWEACALEGVAAGVRGDLLQRFLAALRQDREQLLAAAESAVGKESAALQAALASGVTSLEQASRAVQSALAVLDEVLPAIAWQRLQAQLPEARPVEIGA